MTARAIVKSLGGIWHGDYGTCLCPSHADKKPSLKVRDDKSKRDGVDLHCFSGCSWQEVKSELQRRGLLDGQCPEFRTPPRPSAKKRVALRSATLADERRISDADEQHRIAYALKLWEQSVPLIDTLGWRYFTERRGLHIGLLDDLSHALRWHEGISAVVALMTDPVSNEPIGVHRTFLNPDGTKRERKMLGKTGVIRLSRNEDVHEGLGLTEGIEDGLAVLLSGWAPT
jgi:hypothetical protein